MPATPTTSANAAHPDELRRELAFNTGSHAHPATTSGGLGPPQLGAPPVSPWARAPPSPRGDGPELGV